MENTEKRKIRAEVKRNGIVLYSEEIPEIGVYTYKKEEKTERRIIRNYSGREILSGFDKFNRGLIYVLLCLLILVIIRYTDIDLPHKVYFMFVIPTTLIPLISVCRRIYDAQRNAERTMRRTAIWKVINAYKDGEDIPNLDEIVRAKPYATDEWLIKIFKMGLFSFVVLSIGIPNFCFVHPIMSLLFEICIYIISIRIALTRFGDKLFAPMQYLITKKPVNNKYYSEAVEALKNYEEVSKEIGVTYEKLININLERVTKKFDETSDKDN